MGGGGGGGGGGVWGIGLSQSGVLNMGTDIFLLGTMWWTSLSKLLATRFSTLSPICGIIYLFIYIETTCCSSRVLNIILT